MHKENEEIFNRYVLHEGVKGTEKERKDADTDDDGSIDPNEKEQANTERDQHGKPHLCATKVQHESYGIGTPIHARHAYPDDTGHVAWYSVVFEHGTEVIDTVDLTILDETKH